MPKFLKVLSAIDIWERFSYYGVRTLLILFLTKEVGLIDKDAYGVYALFNFACYFLPIFAAFFADRVYGARGNLLLGGLTMTFGHLVIGLSNFFPSVFYFGLGSIAFGLSFFKGNALNILDACYGNNHKDRSQGFSFMYMALNAGMLAAAILYTISIQYLGWKLAFTLGGVGVCLGLVYFFSNTQHLSDHGKPLLPISVKLCVQTILGFTCSIMAVGFLFYINPETLRYYTNPFLVCIACMYFFGVYYYMPPKERPRVLVFFYMLFFFTEFIIVNCQSDSVLYLMIDRHTDHRLFTYQLSTTFFGAIIPLSFIIFGIIFAKFPSLEPKDGICRLGISMGLLSCIYLLLWAMLHNHQQFTTKAIYFVGIKIIFGLCGLLVQPLMKNYATLLAPNGWKAFFISLTFIATAIGGLLEGKITSLLFHVERNSSLAMSHAIYQSGALKMALFNLMHSFLAYYCAVIH